MSYDFYTQNNISNSAVTNNLTTSNLVVGILKYPSQDAPNGSIITTNGNGILSLTPSPSILNYSLLYGMLTTAQTTNLNSNDHIKFNTLLYKKQYNISLDVSTPYTTNANSGSIGRIFLTMGYVYMLKIDITQFRYTNNNSFTIQWYNSDTNVSIGNTLVYNMSNNNVGMPILMAIYTALINTRVECRIINNPSTTLNAVNKAYLEVITIDNL